MWQPTHVKVTVKQARNLISKGKNGTNDAFVVIGIGKEKYQTSIKEKCSSPVEWKEECELAIPSQGNKAIVQLTVYHHNGLGMDEFLGQVPLPLSDFDVYEKPKYRFYRLKGKPEKDKKKGEKERGELEVMVNFTVKSESFLDVSGKKEKHKSSLTSLKHIGGSLMSIGSKEKQGLKNFARSVSSKMDKIAKPKRKKSKTPSEGYSGGVLSNDLMTSQQHYGDADPGVISDEDEDDFRFEDDIKINTRTSSPLSTMSRGSSLMHEQVLDTDNEVGSSEDHEPDFSSRFDKIPLKPPRIIDETVETSVPFVLQPHSNFQKVTSFSDSKPQIKVAPPTPEIAQTIIEEEFSFEEREDKSSPCPPEKPARMFEEPVWELKRKGSSESQSQLPTEQKPAFETVCVNKATDVNSEPSSEPAMHTPVPKEPIKEPVVSTSSPSFISRKMQTPYAKSPSNVFPKEESFMSAQSLGDSAMNSERSFMSFGVESEKSFASYDFSVNGAKDSQFVEEKNGLHFKDAVKEPNDDKPKTDTFASRDEPLSLLDGRDSAISLGNDPDGGFSSVASSRPRSISNASSVISSASSSSSPLEVKEKTGFPLEVKEKTGSPLEVKEKAGVGKAFEEIPSSKPKILLKSSSDMDVLLRHGSGGRRNEKGGKRVLSAADSVPSYIDSEDPAIVRSGSLSEKRTTSAQPSLVDEWERKLYGRHGLTGSTENVSISGSRSSLNASRESSVHDVRADDAFTRLPEVKALTLERKTNLENEDDGKKNKRKQKAGFKHRIFNKIGGSRERLNEDSRIVEGGNDRLPSIPSKSKLPQEVHDKFAGKSREDLLEVILNLQSSLEKQVKHSSELEEYIDNLLLRVMEATPHILQVPLKTASGFKGY